jgi:hypothetical protein
MTTYAPPAGSWPDNDGLPDLGYHYPVNEDSDHDGLPDWWEYKYFGNYTHSGGDLDGGGNTLLFDYQHGLNPFIITPPANQWVVLGRNATFNVAAVGTPSLTYQWWFNGTNVLVGATNAALTISNVQVTNLGYYSVTAPNGT